MKTLSLNDNNTIPVLGLGTWKSPKNEVYHAVKEALKVGYQHIDAAWIYQNEEEVGKGIQESIKGGVIQRDDLFITSKLWNSFHYPSDVEKGCTETLTALGLDYIDLYLIHWPLAFKPGTLGPDPEKDILPISECPLADTYGAMLTLKEKGLARSIGVSNFSVSRLDKLIQDTGVVPAINQVELHPYNPQPDLVAYCQEKGIALTGYSPLGSSDRPDSMKSNDEPPLLDNETVLKTAEAEGITPGQLLLAWAIDRGTVTIPKSTNEGRIAENLAAAEHSLSSDARKNLDNIGIQYRYVSPDSWFVPDVTFEGSNFWE